MARHSKWYPAPGRPIALHQRVVERRSEPLEGLGLLTRGCHATKHRGTRLPEFPSNFSSPGMTRTCDPMINRLQKIDQSQ
jgi:hypothetical protein